MPGIVFASHALLPEVVGDQSLEQVANVATLPGIVGASYAMPGVISIAARTVAGCQVPNPSAVSDRARSRDLHQVGSLGSGNHFLEVQLIDRILDAEVRAAFGDLAKLETYEAVHIEPGALDERDRRSRRLFSGIRPACDR